jgi:molecular chaperone GrpE
LTARSHQSPPDARRPGGTDEQQRGRSADIVEEASRESLPASDPPAWTTVAGERDADVVARLQSEMAELKDRLLRALAEQENVRRRAAREREEAVRYAAGDLAADLLPTVDNLARAVVSLPAERTVRDETVRGVLTGLTAIERGLLGALARHGVVRISPTPGETFDPHRHQAMFEVETTAFPEGTVAEVLQPGYAHHDRLLRPAMVGVAKAPSSAGTASKNGAARTGAGG